MRAFEKHRLRRRIRWVIVLLLFLALVVLDQRGWLLVPEIDDLAAYDGIEATVTRVIDGDTVEVDIPDILHDRPTTRVRLWGIDCPEPARFDKPGQPLAADATLLTRTLAGGRTIRLSLEPHRPRGVYGRILAHVHLGDGLSLNEELLYKGLAHTDELRPHAFLNRYAHAQRSARRRQVGVWQPDNVK